MQNEYQIAKISTKLPKLVPYKHKETEIDGTFLILCSFHLDNNFHDFLHKVNDHDPHDPLLDFTKITRQILVIAYQYPRLGLLIDSDQC